MNSGMWKTVKAFIVALILMGLIVLIGQFVNLYRQLQTAHPALGGAFLLILAGIIGYGILYPLYVFFRLPKALVLPEETDVEACRLYKQALIRQLNQHPSLRQAELAPLNTDATDEEVLEQLGILNQEAESVTRNTASQVFVTTAIIQNGSLDGLFVFVSLTRMIWRIAQVYQQRPSLRQLGTLYLNVAATVLLAREIEDLELMDEQLEPLMNMIFGSLFSSLVPGATAAVNLVINSTAQGIANAYLTLRVGLIAQRYMGSLTAPQRRQVRKSAAVQAARLLGLVVKENAGRIRQATMNLSRKSAEGAYTYSKEQVANALHKQKSWWRSFWDK